MTRRQSVRVLITGRVQGVSYRAWTVEMANGLSLSGWVRNLRNGSVEAVFSGEETQVSAMIEACKDGPPAARVASISQYRWEEEVEERFITKPTV